MKKVLIVEDDKQWANLFEKYVSDAKVKSESRLAISGSQAIDMVDEWMPDVILLDMLLAGETGMALLNELRSHDDLAKIPVIVCSNIKFDSGQLDNFNVKTVLDKSTMEPRDVRGALESILL